MLFIPIFSQNRRDRLFFSTNEPTTVTSKDSYRHSERHQTPWAIINVIYEGKRVFFSPETSGFGSA